MQVSIETTSELSRKMTVQVPEQKIQEQVQQRLKSMVGSVKLNGFRPGKTPQSLLQKKYGKGVRQEVVAELITSSFNEAVRDEKLRPVAGPLITPEATAEGEGLRYVADFEVMPEFVLYPLELLEVDRFVSEVTEQDLDDMLLQLREQRRTWHPSDDPAALGDRLTIHFSGESEGENLTNGKVLNYSIVLGSKQQLPGFEEELIGSLVGSYKTFTLEFPQDSGLGNLGGKSGQFSVEVIRVEQSVLPELDDVFVQTFGIKNGDVDAFRADILSSMEREKNRAANLKTKNSVMDALFLRNEALSLPTVLVNEELKSLINSAKGEAEKRKQTFDESAAKQVFVPLARRRVALGLLIGRIVEINYIALDNGRVRRTIEELALSFENPEEVVDWYYANSNRNELERVQSMVLEDQAVDLILEKAKVSEKQISFKELTMPSPQAVQR